MSLPNLTNLTKTTNRILTRYNLENPTLKNLTTTEIIALQNPNKNSCLVTKLEIVKKICKLKGINNSNFNNNLERYINKLKSLENASSQIAKTNNGTGDLSGTMHTAAAAFLKKKSTPKNSP